MTCLTLSFCSAPRYCAHSTDVPSVVMLNSKNTRLNSWLTTPTAATVPSEYRLSINTSTEPSSMISRISIKIGLVRLNSWRRTK